MTVADMQRLISDSVTSRINATIGIAW
jgi:hypothetical protein